MLRSIILGALPVACATMVAGFSAIGHQVDTASLAAELDRRRALLDDLVGFANRATGGAAGRIYEVTTLRDDGLPGSLRHGAERDDPLWIVFRVSGTIRLRDDIDVASNKTIDGRGRAIDLVDYGLRLRNASNIIVTHLKLTGADDDAIQVYGPRTRDVWIHHSSLSGSGDGLIDITEQATDVTISWCRFTNHQKPILIGATPDATADAVIRVTLHHNFFDGTHERHPRARYGKVHAFNNLLRHWKGYGIGASQDSQLLSERNIFEAGESTSAIVRRVGDDHRPGIVRSSHDWKLNGARIDQRDASLVFRARDYYAYRLDNADAALRARLQRDTGRRPVGP